MRWHRRHRIFILSTDHASSARPLFWASSTDMVCEQSMGTPELAFLPHSSQKIYPYSSSIWFIFCRFASEIFRSMTDLGILSPDVVRYVFMSEG